MVYCVFRIYTNLSLVFHYNVVYNKQRLLPNLSQVQTPV
ncbi:recombinase RecU [Staphylococcus aureus]|nr:recombinase RecU [Staphylococcus aureus]PZH41690.1 recombinase RecU [Staphylococcus aureus]PZH58762.1 recombinase RecU [Staphylococcus aureus]PZI05037.1 recombinase RecU [Staphylococcus aureus]PZI06417.1 recombinase RecU [Staphylococcus aureus]